MADGEAIEGGSYEVIRARLVEHARELGRRASALDESRRATFGGGGLSVIANERVRTPNNCVPRDMAQVRGRLLFGYNVFIGLRKETVVADVFSLHRFERLEGSAEAYDLGEVAADAPDIAFLHDPQFVKEFQDLYRYYKDARLLQLRVTDTLLLAIFQVGATVSDVKVFRWSLPASGPVTYVDNRGDRDNVLPAQHELEWTQTTRDDQVHGRHPHISVLDEVFVETIHGDLTIKIEDNTSTGEGIYSEPVEDPNQSLDDSDIAYAKLGKLLLLRVRPFREPRARYFVYNARTQRVTRLDAIGQACRQLPEDHGIIFPGGYYLESGEHKVFDASPVGLEFERAIRAPNGEDVLYVFHEREQGRYVLFPYNLIKKEVQTPIDCHGYSLFADGRLILFRAAAEPSRVHPVQIWQTPFTSAEHAAATPVGTSFLAKVGNAELVRGISETYGIIRLVEAQEPTRRTYEDLIGAANRALDGYYWLGHEESHDLRSVLLEVRKTAEQIVDEFEKVQAMRRRAAEALTEARARCKELTTHHRPEDLASIDAFMAALTAVRRQRGQLVSLREIRYVDLAAIDALEKETTEHGERTSAACVEFLLREGALAPVIAQIDAASAEVEKVDKAAQFAPITEKIDAVVEGLELVSEIVTQLAVDDATIRARILEDIADVLGRANRARALLIARKKELAGKEGRAEFAAQFKLLGQTVASSIAVADTPERADQELARLMVQLEELEGRFGELDEFTADIAAKREEVYEAFGAHKQALLDARQKRAQGLFAAAERILAGARRRAAQFKDADELHSYFTSDAMIEKLRQLAAQLRELGDTVKADEVESQLKSARQEALRGLRDKLDLFEEGAAGLLKLGRHRFHVNTQPIEPTLVAKGGALWLHLGGTDFHERIDDPELERARELWDQHLPSEWSEVYRGEHLAASILFDAEAGKGGLTLAKVHEAGLAPGGLVELVRAYAADRYDEGYERGVHDADAAAILAKLAPAWEGAGLLRFAPIARALAGLYWSELAQADAKAAWHRRARSAGRLRASLGLGDAMAELSQALGAAIRAALEAAHVSAGEGDAREAGRYLAEELASSDAPRFTTSGDAVRLRDALLAHVDRAALEEDLRAPGLDLGTRLSLARAWVRAFLARGADAAMEHAREEAVALLLTKLDRSISEAPTMVEVTELVGSHPRIESRTLRFALDAFVARLRDHLERRVPAYRAYRKRRQEIVDRERARMRLEELRPKPMTTFVRNRLIDEVYLPVIGDNLAKQLGAAGDAKRTDLMGMLLLVSPPGYGKTTLMEYVASRLGLVFVKVNGPALGHSVCSLDPSEAPNATARQEVERINFAFELGNNVMLYLDDIQHTHPELLQKFISLCDAQRKIEGVWRGTTRTYDLRGKKLCVVMAGNPYTESGEKFRIPDMLANRADTYNLGEILQGKEDAFASSYLENALTSNTVLAPLAARDYGDVLKLLRMARGEDVPTAELSYDYAPAEITEILAVMQRLFRARDVLLKVNAQYIASASQQEQYRTEPPFKLQGSYRNMNRLAEKIVAAMNDAELERLIDDHYLGESQTLTSGAEENLLKLAELRGRMSEAQKTRWAEIKKDFRRIKAMGGSEDDPVTRVTGTLSTLGRELESIKGAVIDAASKLEKRGGGADSDLGPHLAQLSDALRALSRPQLEVTVQSEPPPAATELFAQQVKLVENAVLPLVRTLGEQLDDGRVVYIQIVDILERLKSIEKRLG